MYAYLIVPRRKSLPVFSGLIPCMDFAPYFKFFRNHLRPCMKIVSCIKTFTNHLGMKLASDIKSFWNRLEVLYPFLYFHVHPFWIQLCYFISISSLGFLVLKALPPNHASYTTTSSDLDMFFMSVSAATVSSMATVEMEAFSDSQLLVLTIMMLVSGEVFTSCLGLLMSQSGLHWKISGPDVVESGSKDPEENVLDQSLSGSMAIRNIENVESAVIDSSTVLPNYSKNKSLGYLSFVVLGYLLVVLVIGSSLITLYLSIVNSARGVLRAKGIKIQTFAIFTAVSSFTNCGFIPTNENMEVFRKDSGLLLLIIPLILAGNTLYPPFLRLVIWVLWRISKREEFEYMLKNHREMGYDHLLPGWHCVCLFHSVVGFVIVQFILFCSMEWNSDVLSGMNNYQKVVGVLFMSVNSRHAGESIVDLSSISQAILVLYVLMMYLPAYTCFLPIKDDGPPPRSGKNGKKGSGLWKNLILSQLSYLVIFIILICITERKKMKNDPLNFNVLNIAVEVTSAYGGVGFSTSYSCKRQIKPNTECKDAWYGFSGRWSSEGKLILIIVMFLGRLKKFNMQGGKAWKLS